MSWNHNCAIDKNLLLHSGYTECLPNFRPTYIITSLKLCSVTDNYTKFKKRAINKSYNSYRTLASDICLQSISCFWNWLKWGFFWVFLSAWIFFVFLSMSEEKQIVKNRRKWKLENFKSIKTVFTKASCRWRLLDRRR